MIRPRWICRVHSNSNIILKKFFLFLESLSSGSSCKLQNFQFLFSTYISILVAIWVPPCSLQPVTVDIRLRYVQTFLLQKERYPHRSISRDRLLLFYPFKIRCSRNVRVLQSIFCSIFLNILLSLVIPFSFFRWLHGNPLKQLSRQFWNRFVRSLAYYCLAGGTGPIKPFSSFTTAQLVFCLFQLPNSHISEICCWILRRGPQHRSRWCLTSHILSVWFCKTSFVVSVSSVKSPSKRVLWSIG